MLTNEQIDERIEALAEGDSNDEEIDGLTEIIRDLQTGREQVEREQALEVKAAAIKLLDERETEFLVAMLEAAPDYSEGEERASLDELRAAYEEHHDAIWLDDDGLAGDNDRHEADDYYQGYVAGAAMVLEQLHRVFKIEPPVEVTVGDRVRVKTNLNGGRYLNRLGTVEEVTPSKEREGGVRLVVKLDKWTPGLESPDGRLYLNTDEIEAA